MNNSPRAGIVKDYFDALNKEDHQRSFVNFSADAKFHVVSKSATAPEIQGVANYKQYRSSRPRGEMHYEPGSMYEQRTCVVVKTGGKYTGPAKGDKEFLPINLSHVFRFNDDNKIFELWVFE